MWDLSRIRHWKPSNATIQALPPELLLRIFAWLLVRDRVQVTAVCRFWREMSTGDPLLWATSDIPSLTALRALKPRFKAAPLRLAFRVSFTVATVIACVRTENMHVLDVHNLYSADESSLEQLFCIEMPQLRELRVDVHQDAFSAREKITLPVDWGSKYVPRLQRLDLSVRDQVVFLEDMHHHPLRNLRHCCVNTSIPIVVPHRRLFDILPAVEALQMPISGTYAVGPPPRTLMKMALDVAIATPWADISVIVGSWTANTYLPRRAIFKNARQWSPLYGLFTREGARTQRESWSLQCIRSTDMFGVAVSWSLPIDDDDDDNNDVAHIQTATLLLQTPHDLPGVLDVLQPLCGSHHLNDLADAMVDDLTLQGLISCGLVLPSLLSFTVIVRLSTGSRGFRVARDFEGSLKLPRMSHLKLHIGQPKRVVTRAPTAVDLAETLPLMFTPGPTTGHAPIQAVKLERVVISIATSMVPKCTEGLKRLTAAFERLGFERRQAQHGDSDDGGITCEITWMTEKEDREPVLKDIELQEIRHFIPALFD